ncbi:MAG TPA: hypothetical protein VIZ87_04745 [Terrimicrobium sp.]
MVPDEAKKSQTVTVHFPKNAFGHKMIFCEHLLNCVAKSPTSFDLTLDFPSDLAEMIRNCSQMIRNWKSPMSQIERQEFWRSEVTIHYKNDPFPTKAVGRIAQFEQNVRVWQHLGII